MTPQQNALGVCFLSIEREASHTVSKRHDPSCFSFKFYRLPTNKNATVFGVPWPSSDASDIISRKEIPVTVKIK